MYSSLLCVDVAYAAGVSWRIRVCAGLLVQSEELLGNCGLLSQRVFLFKEWYVYVLSLSLYIYIYAYIEGPTLTFCNLWAVGAGRPLVDSGV